MTTLSTPERRAGLSFEQTVPCSQAHRRCLGEVFVADTAALGGTEFLAAIQIPRAHSLWSDRVAPYHDPLAVIEAIRQAMTVIGHRYLQVPSGSPLSLQRMQADVEDLSALYEQPGTPLEGIVRIHTDRQSGGSGYFTDSSFTATLTVGAATALSVRGGGVAFPPEAYREFRTHQQQGRPPEGEPAAPVEPAPPGRVGRRDPRNVVIGDLPVDPGDSATMPLIVDQLHPSFFDHPYDHVPGPLMLEGFRQAALAIAGPQAVVALNARFSGFAELHGRLDYLARYDGDAEVDIALSQFGTTIAECLVELSPHPIDAQPRGALR
ncbi:AfsA-related hotdog domain-containing protein [Nocardia jiangsuensis]|uniref:AfsA-related hotdog domain-containing protein n=1 Tax=Nocardia jiangsuensis TaxID=1691563 RepID=A0ABV8DN25_9NOCA